MYMITNLCNMCLKSSFIKFWNREGLLERPYGKMQYSYCPERVTKAAFYSSPSRIQIKLKVLLRSSLVNTLAPQSSLRAVGTRGRG